MNTGPLDTYLRELERLLRARGHEPSRLVAEAREHLADAVEDGLRRGLAREDAEREAIHAFGPPELIAAQAPPVRSRTMARLTTILETLAGHWRWLTAATAAAALLASVASSYLPTRYRSEMLILVESNRTLSGDGDADRQSRERLQTISRAVLSRPRLEGIVKDFGLDKSEGLTAPGVDTVQQMRRNISVEVLALEQPDAGGAAGTFKVSFQSADPRVAMRVTERLASLFIQENLETRITSYEATIRTFDAEIESLRFRLAELEAKLTEVRAQHNATPLRAEMIPFEVLQERYRELLSQREDARFKEGLERRAVGERYRVVEPARVPERPLGPSRAAVTASGAFTGLALSVVTLVWRKKPPSRE
jgi:uncharacterized protein involved in exopolysaccharide biosynthesis